MKATCLGLALALVSTVARTTAADQPSYAASTTARDPGPPSVSFADVPAGTRTVDTGFDVNTNGFSFYNESFGDVCYTVVGPTSLRYDPKGTFCGGDWGLSGGMALEAGERFRAGLATSGLSRDGAKATLVHAQLRTLAAGSVGKFLNWVASKDDGARGDGPSIGARMKDDWFRSIRPRLDRRAPVVVGLVRTHRATLPDLRVSGAMADLTHQHQVLAIGYTGEKDRIRLRAYDPNYPKDVLELSFTLGSAGVTERLSSRAPLEPGRGAARALMFVVAVDAATASGASATRQVDRR